MLEQQIAADRAAGFRPGVGLIVLHQEQILLGRQAGWHQVASWTQDGELHIDDSVPQWKFALEIPQGGIDEGEDLAQAFYREAREELGLIATAITEPEFILRTETRFPFERDGIRYRGKSTYYCVVDAGYLGMNIGWWFDMFMDSDDDWIGPAYPTPGFPGGVHLYNHNDAVGDLRQNRLGRKTDLMISVLDDLLRLGMLSADKKLTFSAVDIPIFLAHPPEHPCSLESFAQQTDSM